MIIMIYCIPFFKLLLKGRVYFVYFQQFIVYLFSMTPTIDYVISTHCPSPHGCAHSWAKIHHSC